MHLKILITEQNFRKKIHFVNSLEKVQVKLQLKPLKLTSLRVIVIVLEKVFFLFSPAALNRVDVNY